MWYICYCICSNITSKTKSITKNKISYIEYEKPSAWMFETEFIQYVSNYSRWYAASANYLHSQAEYQDDFNKSKEIKENELAAENLLKVKHNSQARNAKQRNAVTPNQKAQLKSEAQFLDKTRKRKYRDTSSPEQQAQEQ